MNKFIVKMNALWYEHQAVAARGALRRVGEVMPVKVVAGVRIQIVGVAS